MNHRIIPKYAVSSLALAATLAAQDVTFTPPPSAFFTTFGAQAVTTDDLDGLGRRDVVVSGDSTGSGSVVALSSETGLLIATWGGAFTNTGTAMATGDFQGLGTRDIVVSEPSVGLLWVMAADLSLSNVLFAAAVPSGAVGALAVVGDLTGDGVPEVALGDPTASPNCVHIVDVTIPTTTGSAVLYSITEARIGSFGAALAADGNRLAIGAPTFFNVLPAGPAVGFVSIYRLTATGAVQVRDIVGQPAPLGAPREFGRSLAAVGDLDGNGIGDFAVLAPSTLPAAGFVALMSEANPLLIDQFNYNVGSPAGLGRIASAGDLTADGRPELVFTTGLSLHVASAPAGGPIVQIDPTIAGAFDGAVIAGAAIFGTLGMPFGDVLVASGINTAAANVRVQPVAATASLPNPPGCAIVVPPASQRPSLGFAYPLTVTSTSPTAVLGLLAVSFPPVGNIPFANGTVYLDPGFQVLGVQGVSATSPITFNINLPPLAVFVNVGLVFQASTIDASNTFLVSNGIVARIGL